MKILNVEIKKSSTRILQQLSLNLIHVYKLVYKGEKDTMRKERESKREINGEVCVHTFLPVFHTACPLEGDRRES